MHVVATAGHVDHGKSTLLRALTGTDPDRLPEEQRRGLTTDLGFVWTRGPDGGDGDEVAFVAADGGWIPQSSEHLDALDALGVERGLLVLTGCDLTDATRREEAGPTGPGRRAGRWAEGVAARQGERLRCR